MGVCRIERRLLKIEVEGLEIDGPGISLELITKFAQALQPLVDIVETRNPRRRQPPECKSLKESQNA